MSEGTRRLIETINSIQDVCSRIGGEGLHLDLPQIVVVGGQSVGKSSVLENLVGRDFLPRGPEIVTRCPLVLQLIHNENEEYGIFRHDRSKKFFKFNEIREEIQRETNRKVGNNKNISSDPINLRIYSPDVLDLTLIDLPGIIRNPIGDQPKDIEQQIIKLVLDYIRRDNCLILAVSPANQDLVTSDAIKLAREVDPNGVRTIGVLTKLDLMDRGTDARDILNNKVLPLKRGYIGVVNRSQSDIVANTDIESAIEAEENFFQNHKVYGIFAHRMGTSFLLKTLQKQLSSHIKNSMNGLVQQLETGFEQLKREKKEFDKKFFDNESKKKIILNALKEIKNNFEMNIGLVLKSAKVTISSDESTRGTFINQIMNSQYRSAIQSMLLNDEEMRNKISLTIDNIRGVHMGLFTPDMAFDVIVMRELARFEEPSNTCVDLVSTELLNIVRECCEKVEHYPKLRETVKQIVTNHIEIRQTEVKDVIKDRIKMESSYMNIDHEDFIGLAGAIHKAEEENIPKDEHLKIELIRLMVDSYLRIMKKNITDFIPKLLMHGVISNTQEFLSTDLQGLLLEKDADELLQLNPETEKIRKEFTEKYESYNQALAIIHQISNESF